jgi:mannose-6-phosphate isomerase-like protein (cupin superfamily)
MRPAFYLPGAFILFIFDARGGVMRVFVIVIAIVALCGITISIHSGAAQPGQGRGGERGTYILQQAPADRAVDFSLEWLQNEYRNMDAAKRQTTRMLEGGKYNVNIRRITAAETALVHPVTADVWVVTEGAGTLTTGGELKAGKIVGGVSREIKVGDVIFVPAGVPHGVSGVKNSITWLNIRFDTNWAPPAPAAAAPR